jgi:hypothetical protein
MYGWFGFTLNVVCWSSWEVELGMKRRIWVGEGGLYIPQRAELKSGRGIGRCNAGHTMSGASRPRDTL